MARHSLSPRTTLSLGIILLLVAAVVLFFDLDTWRLQNRAAQAYVPIDGTVLSVALQEHSRRRGSSVTWSPRIGYRYTVAGRTYENDLYAFVSVAFAEQTVAQQILDAHPVGGPIRVHYDPDEPAQSVLSTVSPSAAGLWFPVLLGACGVMVLVSAFRRSRSAQPGVPRGGVPA